jgi:hypothetical protein
VSSERRSPFGQLGTVRVNITALVVVPLGSLGLSQAAGASPVALISVRLPLRSSLPCPVVGSQLEGKLRAIRNRLSRKLLCAGTCAVFSANAESSASRLAVWELDFSSRVFWAILQPTDPSPGSRDAGSHSLLGDG